MNYNSEIELIKKISNYLNINKYDFQSIQSMFFYKGAQSIDKWYAILEIDKNASNDEIKKAHEKLFLNIIQINCRELVKRLLSLQRKSFY